MICLAHETNFRPAGVQLLTIQLMLVLHHFPHLVNLSLYIHLIKQKLIRSLFLSDTWATELYSLMSPLDIGRSDQHLLLSHHILLIVTV